MQALTVSQVVQHLSHIIAQDEVLQDVWIQGEVSNLALFTGARRYSYWTLKDDRDTIKCACFKQLWNLPDLTNGQMVMLHGYVNLYSARSEYSFVVDEIQPVSGRGLLYEQLERLKAQLEAEGLFLETRKRPLPSFPRRLGVVTSPDTAALQDVRNVLTRRFPLVEVVLSPTPVQGDAAPAMIVRAIQRLNEIADIDVILVCRGGGSLENLWCFNDERVVRAVAASRVPVITGVGHETDFTLADFASDMRAPTPSAAAELLTPDVRELRDLLAAARAGLEGALADRLSALRADTAAAARMLGHYSPRRSIDMQRQRVDEWHQRLERDARRTITLLRERLEARRQALESANPQAALRRGYALVMREDGKLVRSVADAPPNTAVRIQLQDGSLKGRVEGT
jgi:exodeoxyribonuclease VII large subunit